MDYIIKSINDWIKLIKGIIQYKEQNNKIIQEGINFLENIKNNKLIKSNDCYKLFNLFLEINIYNINDILTILNSLNNYYNLKGILIDLENLKSKYGITKLAFTDKEEGVGEVNLYYSVHKITKLYLPKNLVPNWNYDLESNGLDKLKFSRAINFIIDYKDIKNKDKERVMYAPNFRISSNYFPTKEEMDNYNINLERKMIFKDLLDYLKNRGIEFSTIIASPNLVYKKEGISFIRSDGEILDEDNQELLPTKGDYFGTNEIKIRNAKFLLITKIIDNKELIYLVVAPSFYKELDIDTIKIIDAYKIKANVRSLMLK